MRRWIFAFFLIGIFFFMTIALISWKVSFPLIVPNGTALNAKFYDYSGITHVHTILSTGSGTVAEITKSAYRAHCDFIIVTDLNPADKPEGVEGYRDGVLVMWAGEYSYLGGHLLTYDLRDLKKFKGLGQLQIFFNDLLEKAPRKRSDGLLIAAHPFLPQHSIETLKSPGLDGMEVLNLDSVWQNIFSQNKLSILWSFLIFPFNADLAYLRLYSEPTRELAAWDENLQKRPFIGFGGQDSTANAIPFPDKSFKFPSYLQSFRLMKDHVLMKSEFTGSYFDDRTKLVDALEHGNFYFSLDLIGEPNGFYFVGQQRGQEALLGSTLSLNKGPINLIVDLGRDIGIPHEIVLLKNGQRISASNTSRLDYEVRQPGAYRAIVRVIPTLPIPDGKTWYTWIYSNAIRIE
jgi:hypothetical protein